jgi:hypothetical protein
MHRKLSFAGRSMMWSALLYMCLMLAINWDDVSKAVHGTQAIVVNNSSIQNITEPAPAKANINAHSGVMKTIVIVIKAISGISSFSK